MSAKHTPGPWGRGRSIYLRGDRDGPSFGWLMACEPGSPEDLEARANARLIAAAPDMLEALKEYDRIMLAAWPGGVAEMQACRDHPAHDLWPQVRSAIAKAEG